MMERVRENIVADRTHTNESLSAERAGVDSTSDVISPVAQRALDDILERGRMLADRKLWKFRDGADTTLADNRRASNGDSSVAIERQMADDGTKAERKATDAIVAGERHGVDAATAAKRQAHDSDRNGMKERRQNTDDQLSMERYDTDMAVRNLGETKGALAHAYGGHSPKGDVLAMVSHDLRSPLAIISMSTHVIAELVKDPEALAAVDEVSRATARMERLLTDLLDVARIESGALRVVKRQNDVCAFLAEVYRSYQPIFEDRGIAFAINKPPEPIFASFDHDRIVQVLSNLLCNALKFTPTKGTVTVHVARRAENVEFGLQDSGPGIGPDEMPNIFKRFWQIDSARRRGLGLGLHICEKIVAEHGGRIWAESELGKGTTFRFTLPIA
jgi:signal transduction histidine kinase